MKSCISAPVRMSVGEDFLMQELPCPAWTSLRLLPRIHCSLLWGQSQHYLPPTCLIASLALITTPALAHTSCRCSISRPCLKEHELAQNQAL